MWLKLRSRGASRWVPAALGFVVLTQACESSGDPLASDGGNGGAAVLRAVEPLPDSGVPGTDVEPVPTVRVTTSEGRPLRGVSVRFHVVEGSGFVALDLTQTDEEGLASPGAWRLGATPGLNVLRATEPSGSSVTFSVVAAGRATGMSKVLGDGQIAPSGSALPVEPQVRVVDFDGHPLEGAMVSFEVLSGGGSVERDSVTTDIDGQAGSGSWTLGGEGDVQLLRATAGPFQVVFLAATRDAASPRGQLAFVSAETGDAEIYVSDADGGQRQRLTTSPGLDFQPAWSPDGSRLAFASEREVTSGIYTMAVDGSGLERVAEGTAVQSPAWSPDGTKIAFERLRDGSFEVVAVDLSGSAVTVITSGRGYEGQPAWSPDGARLAYVSDEVAYDFAYDVYTSNADGSEPQLLTDRPFGWPDVRLASHPTWSPDGTMIAYVYGSLVDRSGPWSLATPVRFHVGLMTTQGDFIEDVATIGDMPWSSALDPGPVSWSPDGRGIAYTSLECPEQEDASCTEVRYVPLVGGSPVKITDGWGPAWRP